MAEAVPLSPQKDEGSPLPSPSNPDIETTETEQAQQSLISINDADDKCNTEQPQQENNNDTNNIEDKANDNNNTENQDDEDNNTIIKPSISMILDTEPIPDTHMREPQMSTTKILNIAKQLDNDKKPQNDDNEEKEPPKNTQKQIQIKVEHGHTSKQGIRPSMEVLSMFCCFITFKHCHLILALRTFT